MAEASEKSKNFHWQHGDAQAVFKDNVLSLKSAALQREIDFSSGVPRTIQVIFEDAAVAGKNDAADVKIAGLEPFAEPVKPGMRPQVISAAVRKAPDFDRGAFYAEIVCFEEFRRIEILYRYILHPNSASIGIEVELTSAVAPLYFRGFRHHKTFNAVRNFSVCTVIDTLVPVEKSDCRALEFRMRTDYHDDLLREEHNRADGMYHGNIFSCGKLTWLQEAPPSEERMEQFEADFAVQGNSLLSCGGGFTAFDILPGVRVKSCRHVLLAGQDPAELCRKYLRARGYGQNKSAGKITVNPWGSGKFNTLVNEEFLLNEISAAEECGADVYQIDDGFQAGGNLGDLSAFNRCITPDYWEFDRVKFPEGIDKTVKFAAEKGIELSLWFAPGCNREFNDDSLEILRSWKQKYGISTFKLDGVVLDSSRSHNNFRHLLEELDHSGISVNLDVTNGLRGGVCEFGEFGAVFLENRYVTQSWVDVPYDPEATLKNLWELSKYIPADNIQIEAPSPEEIIENFYGKNGRPPRPDRYDFDFFLAVTMPASPLLWFQPSKQSEKLRQLCRKMMDIYRYCRKLIGNGDIVPTGSRPGSGGITGFIGAGKVCFAYRTLEAVGSEKIFPQHQKSRLICSSAPAELYSDGRAVLSKAGSFAIWEIE